MPYDIPRPSGYRIQPFKLQDDEALVASMAQQLLKARLAQARAAAGGGRGGGGSGKEKKGKGAWVMMLNKDTGRYEKQWVEGSTEKERKITMKAEAHNEALDRLGQNSEVSKLLGALRNPGASNLTKQEALKRLNALKSDPAFSDLNREGVDEAFARFTKPLASEVQEEKRKIESSGRLGAFGTSLENMWDRFTTWAGTVGSSDAEKIAASKASAERQARRTEADPYLREQSLREAEEPEMQRGWYERTGGVANALTNAGTTLASDPGMGLALAGGAIASLGTGGLAAPLVGAGLAATGGAMSGDTFFRERLASDPNLTDAQREQAYGEGAMQEQLVGAGLNLIPAVSPAAVRAGRMALAAKGLEGEAAQAARTAMAAKLRGAGSVARVDMPLTAAEGAAVNASQMALSNQNYGDVTGQDVDLSEGVGEAAGLGLAFGLATGAGSAVGAWRAGRARRKAAQEFQAESKKPEAVQSEQDVLAEADKLMAGKNAEGKEGGKPGAAKPDDGGQTPSASGAPSAPQTPSASGAPASPSAPQTPPEDPAPAGDAARPSAQQAVQSQSVQNASAPAPDLPSFRKTEASRQKQAAAFEPDLGEAFENKFRASKEYEGYARHESLRASILRGGAGTDAEQASLAAGVARATEGMRQWRERFILDNWKEAKEADKAAKAAKKAAVQKEAEVQEAGVSWTSERPSVPKNAAAFPQFNDSLLMEARPSGREPKTSSVSLSTGAPAVRRTQPSVSWTSTQASVPKNASPFPRGFDDALLMEARPLAGLPKTSSVGLSTGAPVRTPVSPAARAKKPAKLDLPFTDEQLRIISTYSSKPKDSGKNALIQKHLWMADENALEKLRVTREALQGYEGKTYNRMKVEKLLKSIDQLSERVRLLRGENDTAGNAGVQPDTALGYAGRPGEEVPHPENSGNDRQVGADTSASAGAPAGRPAEAVRIRRAEDQGVGNGGRAGERPAAAEDSQGGAGAPRAGRESGGEGSVGESGSEQPATAIQRAGEGERSAEPAQDAVAGSAADRRSPAEKVADFSRLADRSRKAVVSAVGRASLNRMGAALNSLAKRGFTSVDDVLELRNHIEGNLDAYVELGTVKGDAAGDTIIDGFDRVLDYMKGRRAADEAKASVRAEREARAEEQTLAETMSPGAFAASRVREYLEGLNYRHAVPRNGVEASWRDLPADSEALAKTLRNHLLDEDYNEYATNSEVQSAMRANLADAAYDVLNAAYHAARNGAKGARFKSGAESDRALAWKNEGFDLQFFRDNFDVGNIDRMSPNLKREEVVALVDPDAASRFGEDIVDGAPLCTV